MKAHIRLLLAVATVVQSTAFCSYVAFAQTSGMKSFKDDAELRAFLKKRQETKASGQNIPLPPPPVPVFAPPPSLSVPPASNAPASQSSNDQIVVTATRRTETLQDTPVAVTAVSSEELSKESITTTQEADVDEGGIVKVHGSHLIILSV